MRIEPREILGLLDRQKRFYATVTGKMEAAQRLYDHKFPELNDQLPSGIVVHAPSTASSIIDHFRDNVRVNQIIPYRDEIGTSRAAREKQALLLRIDRWVLDHIRFDSPIDPFVQTVFDMPLRGAACWRIHFDPESWKAGYAPDDEYENRGMHLPFGVIPTDPMGIYPAPGGKWPIPWIVEEQTRSAWEVKQRYPDWGNPSKKEPQDDVKWVEFWSGNEDGGQYICLADGTPVIDMENPYGVVPYVFEYSGMGRLDHTNDPATLAVNMLEKAESEIQAEARIKTALDAIVQYTAWPRLMTTEDPRELKLRWDMGPGGILQVHGLAPDERPDWMPQPVLAPGLFNFLPLIGQAIERATFSSALEGRHAQGVDAGYLQSLLVGQASLRKDNIIGMASRMFARGVGLIERIMVHLELGPFVLGPGTEGESSRTFSPKRHIGNRFDLRVTIEASDPAERDRKMLAWLSPLRAGSISLRTYLKEGLMVDDPDEEIAQIHAEHVINQLIGSGVLSQSILAEIQSNEQTSNLEGMVKDQLGQVQAVQATPGMETQPGVPAQAQVSSPLSVVKQMQSVNQRATSLRKGA